MTASNNLLRKFSKQAGPRQAARFSCGIDANCSVDDSDDQRGVLVKELLLDVGVAVSGGRHVEEEGGFLLYKPDICWC